MSYNVLSNYLYKSVGYIYRTVPSTFDNHKNKNKICKIEAMHVKKNYLYYCPCFLKKDMLCLVN